MDDDGLKDDDGAVDGLCDGDTDHEYIIGRQTGLASALGLPR